MDAASDASVPLDSPVGNFNSEGSDEDAKYAPGVATAARASPRDDTSDMDVMIAGCVFPVEDYLQVAEGLCRHPSWMVYPKQLASCLIAACEIVHAGDEEAERKSLELTRLYREMTPSAFEKCVVFDDVVNWDRHIQLDILVACKALAELVSVKLSAALVTSPRRAADEPRGRDGDAGADAAEDAARTDEETPEESDALALLAALTWTFDRASAFHACNRFEPVPREHRNHDLLVDVDRGFHAAVSAAAPSDARRRRDSADAGGVIDIAADDSDATARGGDADGFGYELDSRDGFGVGDAFGTRRASVADGEHEWLGYILDAFGSNGGFVSICDALRGSEKISFALLDATGKAAAACAGELTRERLGEVAGAVEAALARVAHVARRDVDGTESQPLPSSPSGDEDRPAKNAAETKNEKKKKNTVETFSRASSFLRSARRVLTHALGAGEAERRVSEAHRAVVEGLLGVQTFNAQLAALREINLMLESARGDASGLGAAESAAAAEAATSWIARARVVARALRPTYLHHKQYVDQLCVLLRHLSQERALEDAHVDALWDVAFRPDAFEETRKNVAALLADVARDFSAEQLDALFRRVERVFGAARAGTSGDPDGSASASENPSPFLFSASANDELLEMVRRLAKGDLAGAMAERTLLLLWRAAVDGPVDGSLDAFAEREGVEKKPETSGDPARGNPDPPRRTPRLGNETRGAAGAPPRAAAFFARVLEHYDRAGVASASVERWTRRALEAIADAREPGKLAAAASLFRAVVSADADAANVPARDAASAFSPRAAKKKGLKKRRAEMEREARERAARRRARIRALASSSDVVETLVSAVERCSERTRGVAFRDPNPTEPTAAPQEASTRDSRVATKPKRSKRSNAPRRANVEADDRALATVVDTTLFVLKDGLVRVGPATGRRLWAALAEAPAAAAATPETAAAARDRGARWMTELLMSPPRVVTPACCLELLMEVITRRPPSETTVDGWFLFRSFFLQAALDANRLAPKSPATETRSRTETDPPFDVDRAPAVALALPFDARAASPAREEVIDIDVDQEGEAVPRAGGTGAPTTGDVKNERELFAHTSESRGGIGIGIGIPEDFPNENESESAPVFLADVAADELRVAASCDVAAESASESFAGLEHLWRVALDAPGDDANAEATSASAVATFAADALIQIHVALTGADPRTPGADPPSAAAGSARETRAREAFLKRTLEHLGEAARAIASASAAGARGDAEARDLSVASGASAERRASRCLLLLGRFIDACERADPARRRLAPGGPGSRVPDPREAVPHGGSFRGHPVELEVAVVAVGADVGEGAATVPTVPVRAHLNATVRWVKRRVARAVSAARKSLVDVDCDNVRLVVQGRDLGRSDDEPLAACLRRDELAGGAVRVHALVHRTDARAAAGRAAASGDEDDDGDGDGEGDGEGPGAEARRETRRRRRSPRALLARRAETYDALFELSDGACAVVRARAQELLRALPTRGDVRDELRALLDAPGGRSDSGADAPRGREERPFSFPEEEARSRRERLRAALSSSPSRGAYALQALDGLLTPPGVSVDALLRVRESARGSGGESCAGDRADASEEDVRESREAEEARTFRETFARLGFARDVLALLPRGVDAADASLDDAVVDVSSARAAWRDPELRRATCASALSVLSVSLARPRAGPLSFPSHAETTETTTETTETDAADARKTPEERSEDDDASFASFAADAAPSLATLARAFSDETAVSDARVDATGADETLATTAVTLFFKCASARASFEREDTDAKALLRVSCFPATLRDLLTRARACAVRRAFAVSTLRAVLWYPPADVPISAAASRRNSGPREKRKNPKGSAGCFRAPPGFADAVLAALADAEARPARCREYFQVLSALLRRQDEDDARMPNDPSSQALNEEEREANAKLDVAASALFARETEALRIAPPEMDKEAEPDPRLLSRLETLLTILDRLDRRLADARARAEVDSAVTRLARTLLYRCLFPEAAPLLRPAEAALRDAGVEPRGGAAEDDEAARNPAPDAAASEDDPEDASFAARFGLRVADLRVTEAHLTPACATPATRRAAFALLARLAARRAASADFAAAARDAALAGDAEAPASPCGEEILDTVAALHHSTHMMDFAGPRPFSGGFAARPANGYVGLKNAGATCYMNAVFQQMFATPRLRDAILAAPETDAADVADSVLHQLRATFAALALSRLDHFAPRGFWRAFKDYDGEPINVREHQDGLEFFGRLQDMVDAEYKKAVKKAAGPDATPSATKGPVETAMGGAFVNQIISKSCPHRSERVEDFTHVSVEVRGKKGLEESLASYVSGELLEADNQWSCEACGAKRDAVKRSCFRARALPATLCVHLKRFEFDYETMQRHKIKSRFEFPETLDMAPYTVEALESNSADEATTREKIEYRLAGVVVHSGTAFAGHYYSYIRERVPPPGIAVDLRDEPDVGSRWHSFDDQRVEPYDVSNLEADAFGGTYQVDASTLRAVDGEEDDVSPRAGRKRFDRPNSAYMLFYDRVVSRPACAGNEGDANEPEPVDASEPGGGPDDSESLKERGHLASRRPRSREAPETRRETREAQARLPPSIPAMPTSARRAVMAKNLRFAFESNASADGEYSGFVDALVRALVEPLGKRESRGFADAATRAEKRRAGAAPAGDRRRRRASAGAGESVSRAKKAARVREADTPGGDEDVADAVHAPTSPPSSDDDTSVVEGDVSRDDPLETTAARRLNTRSTDDETSTSSPSDAARATLGARFALASLCRACRGCRGEIEMDAPDADSLRRWRDVATALVRASPPARLWTLRWARSHPRVIESFLGAPGPSAEAREAFSAVLAAAVAADEEAAFFDETRKEDGDDASDMSRAVDHVVRDVARAAGAAGDANGDSNPRGPVSAWYFRVLAAYARAEAAAARAREKGEKDADESLRARIERLSRLDVLEPLISCARALGTRAGRRRELGQPKTAKLLRRGRGDQAEEPSDAAFFPSGAAGARSRHETVSAVWLLACAMLRACDTTRVRRVFAHQCASRAAQFLGTSLGAGAAGAGGYGFGFRVADLENDRSAPNASARRASADSDLDEDETTLAAIAAEAPSPYALFLTDRSAETQTSSEPRVSLSLGAFYAMFDFTFTRALAKTAAEPGWHAAGVGARDALRHICWRWEAVSYAACVSVLERLDAAEHPEDVAGALRVCEALLRVEDALAPTRSGFVLEGRAFGRGSERGRLSPNEIGATGESPPDDVGPVSPYLRVAVSQATDRRPEDFPSGVIEQAAFEVCAAPKRLLVARFLVRLAEEGGAVAARAAASLRAQRDDFGYVVGALSDESADAHPARAPREAEEEPPPPGGLGSAGRSASYDETLDDPATVLARAEAALARARAARDDGADA